MIDAYFESIPESLLVNEGNRLLSDHLGKTVAAHCGPDSFPDFEGVRVALIGIPDDRGSVSNLGCAAAPDAIRKEFYSLKLHQTPVALADFGNLRPGETLNDTYAALATVVSELLSHRIVPVVLGGSQDLTYGHYAGYRMAEQVINIVSIDSRFDLGLPEDPVNSDTYLGKIILEQPNYLFNFSNVGYQTCLNGTENAALMKKLHFDTHRLGQVQTDLQEAEPILRNADLLTLDISAVRMSDAPGNPNGSPNGFFGQELCQMMYYAGISDKLSGAGIYEYNPRFDINRQTAKLIAQAIWYFLEGVGQRKQDMPLQTSSNYTTYRVAIEGMEEEITFIKSVRSDRWWMKLPTDGKRNRYLSHHLLPCSYSDYQTACNNVVPERWWNAVHKMV
jgi:arginase family enzyme